MIEGNGENKKPEIETPFDGYQEFERDYYLEGVAVKKINDVLDHGRYKTPEIEKGIEEAFNFAEEIKDETIKNRTIYRIFSNVVQSGFSHIAKDKLSLVENEFLKRNLEGSLATHNDYSSYIERRKYDKAYILDHEDEFERDELHKNLRDINNEEIIYDVYKRPEGSLSEEDVRFLDLLLSFKEGLEKQRERLLRHEEAFERAYEGNAFSAFYRCEIFNRLFNPDSSSNIVNGKDAVLADIEDKLEQKGRKIDNNEAEKAWEYVNDQLAILIESVYGKQDYS